LAKPASAKPKPFRRTRLWVASLVALALGGLAAGAIRFTKPGQTLDLGVSDYLRLANALPDAPEANPVLTIEIGDKAVLHPEGGRWAPWPRTKQARFIDAIRSLGPQFIVLDIEYAEAAAPCVAYRPQAGSADPEVYILDKPDDWFRKSLARAGNVVVPFSMYFEGRGGMTEGGDTPAHTTSPDYIVRHALRPPPGPPDRLLGVEGVNPMIGPLADVAAGAGFTSLPRKDADQAIRRVPLLAHMGEHVFPHLGLEMAGLARFGPDYRVRLARGRLVLTSPDGSLSVGVPVGEKASLNMRWPRNLAIAQQGSIPAGPVLDLVRDRRHLDWLDQRWRLILEELDALVPETGWAKARQTLDAAQAKAGQTAVDAAQNPKPADGLQPLRDALDRVEERVVMETMGLAARAEDPGATDTHRKATRAIQSYGGFVATYHETRERFVADVRTSADRLRPHVIGKTVLVGLSITAGTDLHKTPISEFQPGVEVYPAVMRTILSGVAFRRLGPWSEWAVAVLAAWLVGILAARLPTIWATAAAFWVTAIVVGGAYLAAKGSAVLLPVAGPTLAVVVAFGGVSAYRQLTEASSRRWITRVFEQYTSTVLVEEIIADPEVLRLGGERREITVLFSDVAGFTPLSERLAPEKLVALLQHYLGTMTAILHAERATLDKYEGDGIMAFVGAPIEIPDHALRAVRAALAMQEAVPRVREELIAMDLLSADRALAIRVGCSSGPANVGNFGSETRFDYTAMGDTVNLGGRLEEANRWLRTKILVSETTRQGCGEAILFRELGLAQIRGKADPVRLFEPLALAPAPDRLRRMAEAFGRCIRALEQGDADAADAALTDLLAADPDDGPTRALAERLRAVRAGEARPEAPWNLARPKEEAASNNTP